MKTSDVFASLTTEHDTPPNGGWPAGAPARDFQRSPAAARVGRLAAAEGLFCFHFEKRLALDLPDDWIEPGREHEAEAPEWQNGVLPERKYQSFRHDLMIGSFHPGHRGKWTTHELCHTLVGFAWRPSASPLFHATAARLAELLPVVLYYCFDEVMLARCPDHALGGALYRAECAKCEACAAFRAPAASFDQGVVEDGLRYLDGELAACARSRRLGRPLSYRRGSLDLCSDGLAYARGHRRRLDSAAFRCWAELFPGAGMHATLEELEARIEQVARAILLGEPLAPHARRDWVAQDLAMRLLQVREETDGEAADGLLTLAQRLAAGTSSAAVLNDYVELADGFVLPPREAIASVGYALPDPVGAEEGYSLEMVRAGLGSAAPLSMQLLQAASLDPSADFAASDTPVRVPLGVRFAEWLQQHHPGAVAELAAFESALQVAKADALAVALGGGEQADLQAADIELAQGFVVLSAERDVVALAEAVASGELAVTVEQGALRVVDEQAQPSALVMGRDAAGELLIVGIEPVVAQALLHADFASIPAEELASLRQLGVVVPTRWPL